MAKGLWRGELVLAQELISRVIRPALMQMMDWYIGSQYDFLVNPGKLGKNYERYLEPEVYAKMQTTYPAATFQEIWQSVYAMQDLFRHAAMSIASQLGYSYPDDWEKNVTAYMRHVQQLPKDAKQIY